MGLFGLTGGASTSRQKGEQKTTGTSSQTSTGSVLGTEAGTTAGTVSNVAYDPQAIKTLQGLQAQGFSFQLAFLLFEV